MRQKLRAVHYEECGGDGAAATTTTGCTEPWRPPRRTSISPPRSTRARAGRDRAVGGAARRGADRRGALGRERHPALPRAGRSVDEVRRAADGRLPALPARSGRGLAGASRPDAPSGRGRCATRSPRPSRTPGHRALAELERLGRCAAVITQNIDDLHRQAGTRNLLEIHGNHRLLRCLGVHAALRARRRSRSIPDDLPPRCPRLRRSRQGRHRAVRRADPARRAAALLRRGRARGLHAA